MKKSALSILILILPALCALLAVSFLWQSPVVLTLLLLCISSFYLYSGPKADIAFFIIGGIAGSVSEMIAMRTGAWSYADPTAFGIPMWLPVLWGIAGLFIIRLYGLLND
jgi:1,4-dihydroxy-2-naphthoate octaprenyltransferase